MKKLLSIILLTFNYSLGQVVLDSVAVSADFNGVLNNTVLEIYLLNTSDSDSVETFINFNLNKNSIVEKLWLEINNKMKRDITLSRPAGTAIYDRIVGRRIDPAYLIQNNNGNYQLRVFPINKHQRRKIVIEYYSIIGGKEELSRGRPNREQRTDESKTVADNNSLYWFINFQKEAIHKSIKLTSQQPTKTKLRYLEIDSTQTPTLINYGETYFHKFESKNVNEFCILFDYKETPPITKYQNGSLECYSSNRAVNTTKNYYKTIKNIDNYNISPPDFIKYLIQNPKEFKEKTLFINKAGYGCNSFLTDMLKFITEERSNEIEIKTRQFTSKEIFNIWFFEDSTLATDKLIFTLKHFSNSLSKNHVEIDCPYLNKFFEYSKIIYANTTKQIASGYLTENLAKIVIENDSVSQSIKDNILKREQLGKLFEFEYNEPAFFIALEKMPEIVGGLKSVYHHLFYPLLPDSLKNEERIYIKAIVNTVGEIICSEILRSNNETLSQIGKFALSLVEWLPGEQRGKPITVHVSVPLVFNKDSLNTVLKKNYKIDNRSYYATFSENHLIILEEGFEFADTKKINFGTNDFYSLLYNNPDIINLVYKAMYLSNIKQLGLVIKTNDRRKNILISK